uniref:Uncharacterized protein n=1 Tax=viral metagenome TaxID=1070528 RepID=A0A6C0JUD2_9ZZZZ
MKPLNYGHVQNSEKTFNSKSMMTEMVKNIKQANLNKINHILLFSDDVDMLKKLGCLVTPLDYVTNGPLQPFSVVLSTI